MMKKLLRTFTCLTLVTLMLVAVLAGCNGGGGADSDTSFTWWIIQGADSSYYARYEDNPAVRYLLSKEYNGNYVDLTFMVPVMGSEQDNFNTLLATGEYADVMVLTMYSGSTVELYQEGIIIDLTEYIDMYMPNYRALLDRDPEAAMYAAHIVDGERKYLHLLVVSDIQPDTWCGYMYRRDWLLNYGTNPFDGSAFLGGFSGTLPDGSPDTDSWTDNIVFPSGGPDPIFISDWEWMMGIFHSAIEAQGISDGYVMSLYYPGYLLTGDLFCAFGGGGPGWYVGPNNQIQYGGASESMRTYLQAMNTWFSRGWIDRAFAERSADMFYRIDDARVRQGKVGIWTGIQSQLGSGLDSGDELTSGMMAYGARQPINDIYGGPGEQGQTPFTMYQMSRVGVGVAISNRAAEKDLETLLTYIDSWYTVEGGLLIECGLSQEQVELMQDEFYMRHGLEDGAYRYIETEQGTMVERTDGIYFDTGTLQQAAAALRMGVGFSPFSMIRHRGAPYFLHSLSEWMAYTSTGFIQFTSLLPNEDARLYARADTQINEFKAQNIPLFIRGQRDPFDDSDWNNFANALERYNPGRVTTVLQNLLNSLTDY